MNIAANTINPESSNVVRNLATGINQTLGRYTHLRIVDPMLQIVPVLFVPRKCEYEIEEHHDARRKSHALLAILCCVLLISVLPSRASASQQHHIRRQHLTRHHASILHFYPVIPFHATYQVTPTLAVIEVGGTPSSTQNGKLFAYPAHGQSAQQQSQDRYECDPCATREAGLDPVEASSYPPPATVVQTSTGSVGPSNALSGTAGGAGRHSAQFGGAIAGDPGIGAAIGTAVGGTVRLANQTQESTRLRAAARHAAVQNGNDAAATNVQHADYNRAIGACLVARDYQVN